MRMVADFFRVGRSWDTHHLGANTPSASLVDFAAQRRLDLVGLEATMTFHLEAVASIVRALRANQRTRDIRVLVVRPCLWPRARSCGAISVRTGMRATPRKRWRRRIACFFVWRLSADEAATSRSDTPMRQRWNSHFNSR